MVNKGHLSINMEQSRFFFLIRPYLSGKVSKWVLDYEIKKEARDQGVPENRAAL